MRTARPRSDGIRALGRMFFCFVSSCLIMLFDLFVNINHVSIMVIIIIICIVIIIPGLLRGRLSLWPAR